MHYQSATPRLARIPFPRLFIVAGVTCLSLLVLIAVSLAAQETTRAIEKRDTAAHLAESQPIEDENDRHSQDLHKRQFFGIPFGFGTVQGGMIEVSVNA